MERFISWGSEEVLNLRYIAEFSVGNAYDDDQRMCWELRAHRADQDGGQHYVLAAFREHAEAMGAMERLMLGLHEEGHAETFVIQFGEAAP